MISDNLARLSDNTSELIVSSIHNICDDWLLSEKEIVDVYFPRNAFCSRDDVLARIEELEALHFALADVYGDDQVSIVRWLRDVSPDIGGFRPIEYIRGECGDTQRLLQGLRAGGRLQMRSNQKRPY